MFVKVLMMTDEYFRKISFSQKVQLISRCLGLRDPAIVQGMYIFKNPGIGRRRFSGQRMTEFDVKVER